MNPAHHISTAMSTPLGAVLTLAALPAAPTQATPDLSISVDALASDAEPFGTCLTRGVAEDVAMENFGYKRREVFYPYKVVTTKQIHEAMQKMGEKTGLIANKE